MSIQVRPYQLDDLSAVVALNNLMEPEYPQTETEFRWGEENREARIRHARWVALCGEELVGVGVYGQSAGMYHPTRFYVEVGVQPDKRSQGIGGALYNTVTGALEEFEPTVLCTCVRETRPESLQFVARRGYLETMREWESRLDVTAFDPEPFEEHQDRFAAGGIQIRTVAELESDPDRNEKLYHLENALEEDVPSVYAATPDIS